jgi:hypothetical protein
VEPFVKMVYKRKRGNGRTIAEVIAEPMEEWDFNTLSMMRKISIKDVLEHPEYPWKHFDTNDPPKLTLEFINERPHLDWANPDLLIEYINETQDIEHWNWDTITILASLEMIDRYHYLPWNWNLLATYSKKVTWEFVKRHITRFHNLDFVYSLQDVTWDIIVEQYNNPDIINIIDGNMVGQIIKST